MNSEDDQGRGTASSCDETQDIEQGGTHGSTRPREETAVDSSSSDKSFEHLLNAPHTRTGKLVKLSFTVITNVKARFERLVFPEAFTTSSVAGEDLRTCFHYEDMSELVTKAIFASGQQAFGITIDDSLKLISPPRRPSSGLRKR